MHLFITTDRVFKKAIIEGTMMNLMLGWCVTRVAWQNLQNQTNNEPWTHLHEVS
jgi:hypothetical protein